MRIAPALPALFLSCLLVAACRPAPPAQEPVLVEAEEVPGLQEGGAVSTAPMDPGELEALEHTQHPAAPLPEDDGQPDWSPLVLEEADALVSCSLDYAGNGDGEPLQALDYDNLRAAVEPCVERGVLRLRYRGRITAGFAGLVQRITWLADELDIGKRVLDLDSAGGQVEDAVRVGDFIAESRWTIWVREGSVCHSACVFVLGAGDNRLIAGKVGIHRIIRMSSTASSRAELNAELRVVYDRVRDYLERNGVALAVADLMKAVPNRSLRLLTPEELRLYGLDGVNPAQDDLDRLRLMRKCGEDFVRRRDAFVRAFDSRCKAPDTELDVLTQCGLELRSDYGFPDEACPAESPMSEYDNVTGLVLSPLAPPRNDGPDDDAGSGADAAADASVRDHR